MFNIIKPPSSILGTITNKKKQIKGSVVLMKKNVLDFTDITTGLIDPLNELLGNRVSLQLISATTTDIGNELKGKVGKAAHLENWINLLTLFPLLAGESAYGVSFEWQEELGVPEAFIIKNNHSTEFFLKSLTLEDVPNEGKVHFVCNSWVYPVDKYNYDRVFFRNKTYLPNETPAPLRWYREQELINLRGDGTGERKEGERVYDYDYYNDLGNPDGGEKNVRPVLGGSDSYPYPRRGRTGRPPTKTDPNSESRGQNLLNSSFYIPRDERFGHLKTSDFLVNTLKSVALVIKPALESVFDLTPTEFDSFDDVLNLYEGGFPLPLGIFDTISKNVPLETLKELFRSDGGRFLKFPKPHVIKEDRSAWMTDEEFTREMLAGVNPVLIRGLQEFPPTSKLDPYVYGNQNSKITEAHINNNLDGLSVNEALEKNRLFILDHHDTFMPFVKRINTSTSSKVYATRTLLFLTNDGTLKPLAIELSLPHPQGDHLGAVSRVYTPAEQDVEGSIWQLAKAYVIVNDYGYHQLISHWLNTHAVIEPFVIATNRQLSVIHPIYKLLHPHFRDTMNINALARQVLVNAFGIVESVIFPREYSMEITAQAYRNWNLTEQSLPADLIKRGVAVKDPSSPHGLRVLIEDYPYAVDGLEIWSAIKQWVKDYCSFYYKTDETLQEDIELQSWWKELREVGHGDLKDEIWWPEMQTREELIETCATVIWITSALHAAVNFGQYPYSGYIPNRPTLSRRLMPEEGTTEYEELRTDPEKAFLRTITSELRSLVAISFIEILSKHASDEVYLGQRDSPNWTTDKKPLEAFERFGKKLSDIEDRIRSRNRDANLKNRVGPVEFPYNLLYRTGEVGMVAKGIPNSISI
ncbi:Lipoxygenase [Parasponia andersonii]|uniref:Lipoxygenase n=1 Tax=Parasponia andersonii TaxID=3476 RepID=A0A2P5AX77_PARAD|nr:Lipoxygenase [Parasponia andersonii]